MTSGPSLMRRLSRLGAGKSREQQDATDGIYGSRTPSDSRAKAIWLDCDPGHDDAIALLIACHHPRVQLLGVSTVAGNATGAHTFANAARLLIAFGANPKIPLLRGADEPIVREKRKDAAIHGGDGLGGVFGLPNTSSEEVLHRMWSSHGGKSSSTSHTAPAPAPALVASSLASLLTERRKYGLAPISLCITGPCTNIALFLKLYPHLVTNEYIEQIVVMGGSAGAAGNRGPLAEFNFLVDPEAARIVCDAPLKVVMAGLNVTHQAIFTPEIHDRLLQRPRARPRSASDLADTDGQSRQLSPPASLPSSPKTDSTLLPPAARPPPPAPPSTLRKLVSSAMTFFATTYAHEFGFTNGPPVHDALVIAYVVDEQLFYTHAPPVTGMGPLGMSLHRAAPSQKRDAGEAANGSPPPPEEHSVGYADPSRTFPPRRYAVQVDCADNSLALGASVVDFYNQWGLPRAADQQNAHGDGTGAGAGAGSSDDAASWARGGRNVVVLEEVDTNGLWDLLLEVVDRAEAALSRQAPASPLAS